MAGKKDEIVGVDNLTDKLTEPSQKKTYQDLWNAAYRGLVPGGLNANDGPVPALPEGGDGGPEPFDETEQYVTEPAETPTVDAKPVVIMDDFSRVKGSVERYFTVYQVRVGKVGTTLIANRDPRRTRMRIVNVGSSTIENGTIYIGNTESVGVVGFALNSVAAGLGNFEETAILELNTTREVWAQLDAESNEDVSRVDVLIEYEKEI